MEIPNNPYNIEHEEVKLGVCVCVNKPINSDNGGTFCNELIKRLGDCCLRRIDERFVDVTSGDTTKFV